MLIAAYRSTVGKKIVMAVTGLLLIGFLIGHMAGNLKTFAGVDPVTGAHKLDEYAHFLREMGEKLFGKSGLLWIARSGLLVALFLHVMSAIQLAIINRKARSSAYKKVKYNSSTIASRTMYYGGLVIALFIVFHILHFTTGTLHFRGFVEGKVYNNVVFAFQSPLLVITYTLSLIAVALHTYHSGWSLFQTLGLDSPQINKPLRYAVKALAVILFVGFVSVPAAVFFGALRPMSESISLHEESARNEHAAMNEPLNNSSLQAESSEESQSLL